MTAFKPGDRVHVEFDAKITSLAAEGWWPVVLLEGVQPETRIQIAPEFFTLIRAPLAVGDVLTADDPEPPRGTVLMDGGTIWRRFPADGRWYAPGDTGAYEWDRIRPVGSVVLYVPEDTP